MPGDLAMRINREEEDNMISSMAWHAEIADPATWVAITRVASVVSAFFFSIEW
jgi:hypothetical protein